MNLVYSSDWVGTDIGAPYVVQIRIWIRINTIIMGQASRRNFLECWLDSQSLPSSFDIIVSDLSVWVLG